MFVIAPNKYLIGVETEYFVLDSDGRISNDADVLLEKLGKADTAKKECGKNMIEVVSTPAETITDAASDLLGKVEILLETAEKNDLRIFNCSTYPGYFNPEMRKNEPYRIKESIFGSKKWKIAGRCVGFHCHYTLSRGIFDRIKKNIKLILSSSNQAFVDSYNILIAMDTVFATFLQSSPFYQGKLYGKDARMMVYRGNLGVNGVYTNLPDFGALSEYKNVITDIMYLAERRFETWSSMMKKRGIGADPQKLYGSIYDVNWSPVKVNPIGTFELRGMDMNRLQLLISAAVLMRYTLKSVHEGVVSAAISEGPGEPFNLEGGKVFLPSFDSLSGMQKNSATKGMENKEVRECCKNFLDFIAPFLPSDRKKFLKPFRKMISSKMTVSDEIIRKARKKGAGDGISKEDAAEIALELTEDMPSDTKRAEKLVEGLS